MREDVPLVVQVDLPSDQIAARVVADRDEQPLDLDVTLIAGEQAGKITVAKLNIDENPETARNYQVMSIPTMAVFSGGQLVKTIVGARPKAAILRELTEFVG